MTKLTKSKQNFFAKSRNLILDKSFMAYPRVFAKIRSTRKNPKKLTITNTIKVFGKDANYAELRSALGIKYFE